MWDVEFQKIITGPQAILVDPEASVHSVHDLRECCRRDEGLPLVKARWWRGALGETRVLGILPTLIFQLYKNGRDSTLGKLAKNSNQAKGP